MAPQPATTFPPQARSRKRLPARLEKAVKRCWERAAAPAEWGLRPELFEEALAASVEHSFRDNAADDAQIEKYLDGLYASDLALALACRMGNETAWEFFIRQHRADLRNAAQAIVGQKGGKGISAPELADSLYADLYGVREGASGRKSLFDYFHGRSKISTWLRAVLAQRYVDEIRRTRKLESLDEGTNELPRDAGRVHLTSPTVSPPDPEREKYLVALQSALSAALDAIGPRDRLRLAYYYADGCRLAEIGRLLGEHEATVSRKLDRTRQELRQRVTAELRDAKKMSAAQIETCFAYAREEWPFDLTARLRAGSAAQDS